MKHKKKRKKKVHATTGHLDHVTHFYSNPEEAFNHFDNVLGHFTGKKSKKKRARGTISQKADGGMSVKAVRMPNGTVGVGYKTGEIFTTPEQIMNTGKDHYVRSLVPILLHARQMQGLQPGTGFQFDLLHQSDSPTNRAKITQPNTLKYKIPKGHTLGIAAHSQYTISADGTMKKTSSVPDVSQLQAPGVYAPRLGMSHLKLTLSPERQSKVREHLERARGLMTPEMVAFSSTLHTGTGHHKKFKEFHDQYHSHSSRTSGQRSVEEMRKYVDIFVNKKAQSPARRKTESDHEHRSRTQSHRAALRKQLHDNITGIEPHLRTVFDAHNNLIHAKHHILDQMREIEGGFDLQTHAGEEHEGFVSSIGTPGTDEHMAKFVREGPVGFPKKNHENPRFATR
jgi:hypothetical protein